MRTINKNILKPFLFTCLGLIIATIVFAGMSLPFDVPEPPGVPYPKNWSKRHCDLIFTPPVYDGGSPITQYIVQGREVKTSTWYNKGHFDPSSGIGGVVQCTITNVVEGRTYEFRAFAENMAGQSEPSGISKSVIIRDR